MSYKLNYFVVSRFVKVNDEWAEIKKTFSKDNASGLFDYITTLSETCGKCTITFVKQFLKDTDTSIVNAKVLPEEPNEDVPLF